MDKFNLINFISKLMTDKDAQNSLTNIIGKLFSSGGNSNVVASSITPTPTPQKQSENNSVYRSPPKYLLYSEMIKRHDEIAKNITGIDKT